MKFLSSLVIMGLVGFSRPAVAEPESCTTNAGIIVFVDDFRNYINANRKSDQTMMRATSLSGMTSMAGRASSLSSKVCKAAEKEAKVKLYPFVRNLDLSADLIAEENLSNPKQVLYEIYLFGSFVCTPSKTRLSREDLLPCY